MNSTDDPFDAGRSEDQEPLEVVNERNEVTGILPRREVHLRGLSHRAAHVFLFNLANELFLQKRSMRKRELPGYFDSSAAGHVQPSESYQACAARELLEELSVRDEPIRIGGLVASDANAFEHVGLFVCRTDQAPVPNPAEIEHGAFFPLAEIERWIASGAERLSPGFVLLFTRHRTELKAFLERGSLPAR